jgi:hypothetical protein
MYQDTIGFRPKPQDRSMYQNVGGNVGTGRLADKERTDLER